MTLHSMCWSTNNTMVHGCFARRTPRHTHDRPNPTQPSPSRASNRGRRAEKSPRTRLRCSKYFVDSIVMVVSGCGGHTRNGCEPPTICRRCLTLVTLSWQVYFSASPALVVGFGRRPHDWGKIGCAACKGAGPWVTAVSQNETSRSG